MTACPGCDGPKTKRAQLCASCRRRAITVGVQRVIAPPPPGEPRNAPQNSAYHGKCATLAELELGNRASRPELAGAAIRYKRRALEWATERFARSIESSADLSRDEMSDVLDWLDAQIAAFALESTAP